jgi:hypothetical protein
MEKWDEFRHFEIASRSLTSHLDVPLFISAYSLVNGISFQDYLISLAFPALAGS